MVSIECFLQKSDNPDNTALLNINRIPIIKDITRNIFMNRTSPADTDFDAVLTKSDGLIISEAIINNDANKYCDIVKNFFSFIKKHNLPE
jgi:hypothetical protein